MKRFFLVSLLTLACAASAAGLDFYKEGAICDRKSGFCADSMGVSLGLTKLYLGEKAEQKLMAEINKVGVQAFDPTTFTMSSGLSCDTKLRTCWTSRLDKTVDAKATQTLFGR
jgi:hypothetical protein